jgi:four helix bundle protein
MKVWQESHALAMKILEVSAKIPDEQQDSLALMIEKAAIDVPRNIAEGFRRRGSRNKAHYYNLSQSALEGLRYLLILCRDLKYDINYEDLAYSVDQISRMLDGLVRSMSRGGMGGRGGRDRGRRRRGGGGGIREDYEENDNDRDYGNDEGEEGEM